MLFIAHSSLARRRHNLRFISIGEHMRQVVRHHVFGLGCNGGFGFQIRLPRAVTQNLQTLRQVVVVEHVCKPGIHTRLVWHFCIVRAAFINNLQRHAVFNRLAHRVFVNVVAKHPFGFVNGRAGVANACGVGNPLVKIRCQSGVLRTMRLVCHHQNIWAAIELRKHLGQIVITKFVNHRHHQV